MKTGGASQGRHRPSAMARPGPLSHHAGLVQIGHGGGLVVAAARALVTRSCSSLRAKCGTSLAGTCTFTRRDCVPRGWRRGGKTAEAADFDALAWASASAIVGDRLDSKVHVAGRQLRIAARQHGDEFRTWSGQASLVALLNRA